MRRFALLLLPLGMALAFSGCREPTGLPPIGHLNVTTWPNNACGFVMAPAMQNTQGIEGRQLADCNQF